jgi:general secretion pathway protein K
MRQVNQQERGVALLAVLWLSVALSMIAMTTAYLVRTESVAVSNQIEAEQAEYLARGGIEAAAYAILHPVPAGATAVSENLLLQSVHLGQRWLRFEFQQGSVVVELVPDNAKLNVNLAPPEQLAALFVLLGEPAAESQALAAAIMDWRSPRASAVATPLDIFYDSLPQPYAARHGAFLELDELLAVRGMSRELFFGRLVEAAPGAWKRNLPLADLLTTGPSYGGVNLNYAAYEVLRVLPGWDEALAAAVVDARSRIAPDQLLESVPGLSAAASLSPVTLATGFSYTLTAAAKLHDSAVQHSARARIRMERNAPMGFRVTGWWNDWPWSPAAAATESGALGSIGGQRS